MRFRIYDLGFRICLSSDTGGGLGAAEREGQGEALLYAVRPDNTSIWLPEWLLSALGLKRGGRLTAEQMQDGRLQELLAMRLERQKARGR